MHMPFVGSSCTIADAAKWSLCPNPDPIPQCAEPHISVAKATQAGELRLQHDLDVLHLFTGWAVLLALNAEESKVNCTCEHGHATAVKFVPRGGSRRYVAPLRHLCAVALSQSLALLQG